MPDDPVVVSISSQNGLHPDEIAHRTFPSARRGVDPDAVRRYLEAVAAELQQVLDREQALRRKLVDAERRAAEPELDEATLMAAVGAETARILKTAHDAASDVVSKAEVRAAEILSEAEGILATRTEAAAAEASAIIESAEEEARGLSEAAVTEADAARSAAAAESASLTESARAEAIELMDATRTECRRIVKEARQLRASVLSDLASRRKGMRIQLEQLRGGRDTLMEVVDAVGNAVDELRERLDNAELEARRAAADAGGRVEAEEEAGRERVEIMAEGGASLEEASEVLDLLVDEGLAGELTEQALYETTAPGDRGGEEASAGDGGGEEAADHASHRSVDELFARIRANRGEQGDEEADEGVLGTHSAHEAAVFEADEDDASDENDSSEKTAATELEDDSSEETAATEELEDGVVILGPVSETELEEDDSGLPITGAGGDAEALARRRELLEPATLKLSRALKRALQDDQNLLLDAIRHASGRPDLDGLLSGVDQQARLSSAVSGLLAEAWSTGFGWLGDASPARAQADAAGKRLASDLSAEVSGRLRHRLEEGLGALDDVGDGGADVAGAAYREWRGARVEGVAGDFAGRAFSEGAVSGGAGTLVRWVVEDEGGPCPDCDDNALAGELEAGKEFPTGQRHPPVHPGCRCLLVPATS